LLAPIKAAGEHMACGSFNFLPPNQATKNIKYVWMIKGTATNKIIKGFSIMVFP
jgi:hypothetical protein